MPTMSPDTAGWRGRPGRRSTSTGWPRPSTSTSRSPTAGRWSWATRWRSRRSIPPATGPSTPPSCCATPSRGGDPVAVLSGDSLFVGDVARPDLAIEPREGAADDLPLAARAAAGPARRGRGLARTPGRLALRQLRASTSRPPRRSASSAATTGRSAFADEEEFVEEAVSTLGEKPPNVEHIVALNRGPLIETIGAPARLAPRRLRGGDRRRRSGGRLAHQRAVRRGPHPGRDQRLRLRHRLRHQGRPGRPARRRAGHRRRLRRQRARRGRAAGGSRP